jgi:hypothetical protein
LRATRKCWPNCNLLFNWKLLEKLH